MTTVMKNDVEPVVATAITNHNDPTIENGMPGIAIKVAAAHWSAGYGTALTQIAIGERFNLLTHGKVQVPIGALTVVKGTPIYINTTTRALATTGGAGTLKFGMVDELASDPRGVPTGFMRVDLDKRDLFV
jgi:hypothetical protein